MENSNINSDAWTNRQTGDNDPRDKHDYRSPFARDECRVVHSFGFRRLQGKTQILGPEQGDYHRNRMTHSIEVASISRGVALYLQHYYSNTEGPVQNILKELFLQKANNDYHHLITTISLLHDIGHPPFGHGGEVALNYKMHKKHGGFEGNAQTIRLLTRLETFTAKYGLALTRRTLLGLLKYPAPYSLLSKEYPNSIPPQNRKINIDDWKPPKCYYDEDKEEIIDWILGNLSDHDKKEFSKFKSNRKNPHKQTRYKSFDCAIMNIADDIAYSIHDIEDAIYFKLITEESLKDPKKGINKETHLFFKDKYPQWEEDLFDKNRKKQALGHLVHRLVTSTKIIKQDMFDCPLLKYSPVLSDEADAAITNLKKIIYDQVIMSQEIQTIVFGGMVTVMQLFDALQSNYGKLLPEDYKEKIEKDRNTSLQRYICDYIAGMTDNYARRLHMRIYGSTPNSVFEKL